MTHQLRRIDELLERGGPGVDATLGAGMVAFGVLPQVGHGPWSSGVLGGVAAGLTTVSSC